MQSNHHFAAIRKRNTVLMKMGKHLVLLLLALLHASCAMAKDRCDQTRGNVAASDGSHQVAFSMLEHCEDEADASGKTLFNLSVLYTFPEYGSFKSDKERMTKVYKLLYLASNKGDEDALVTLASVYESGEPLLAILPDEVKADCLLSIADNQVSKQPIDVQQCLSK